MRSRPFVLRASNRIAHSHVRFGSPVRTRPPSREVREGPLRGRGPTTRRHGDKISPLLLRVPFADFAPSRSNFFSARGRHPPIRTPPPPLRRRNGPACR